MTDPENGESESDVTLATVELGLAANLNENVSADILFLFEEDETDLEVDTAQLRYDFSNSPLSLTAGQIYVPFGTFQTALISDTLTLELGETRESALLLEYEQDAWSGSFYLFNGDNNEDGGNNIDSWGANVAYTNDRFSLGFGFINNIGDSDALQDSLSSNDVCLLYTSDAADE